MRTRMSLERHWLFLEFLGEGTPAEVKAAYEAAVSEVEKHALPGIILETRESQIHPSFEAMRDLAQFALSLREGHPPVTALIVGGPLQYGLARMFASLVEFSGWDFAIFRDNEAAEAWILERTSPRSPG